MRVLILLTGEITDIQDIKSGLFTSVWTIVEEPDGFYLNSPELDVLTDHVEILSKAKQFLDTVNGAASIVYFNHKHVGVGAIKEISQNGKVKITGPLSGHIEMRSRARGTLTTKDDPNPKPVRTTIEYWLEKAVKYENVRDVLHFFNEITWWNLYKVYEIIKDDAGEQSKLYKIVPKTEIRLFTQAAQSRELLGDLARHASKKNFKRPVIPLTLIQAHGIIKNLFETWISLKE